MSENKTADLRPQVEVPLQFPVTIDGQSYKTLTMRRPKVADNKWAERIKGSDFVRGVALIARLCDVPPEVIDELDEFDATKLNDQLESFRSA